MLSECSSRLNQIGGATRKMDPRSPYLLQFKIFQDRMKKPFPQGRSHSYGLTHKQKNLEPAIKNDYMKIVRNFLEKNENINIFEDIPYQQTEPSIDFGTEMTVSKIRRKLEDRKTAKTEKCRRKKVNQLDCFSQATQNLTIGSRSRVRSEIHPNQMMLSTKTVKEKSNGLSFIGYKKDKKFIESGCKRVRGLF